MRDRFRGRGDLHPAEAHDGADAVLRVMLIFAPIPVFWALWDQKGSTWIVQATQMDLNVGPGSWPPRSSWRSIRCW